MTTTTIPTNALDMLEETAKFIETHRWGRHGMTDYSPEKLGQPGSCPCLEESLAIVAGRMPQMYGVVSEMGEAELTAYNALCAEADSTIGTACPWIFNDGAGKDKRKVVRFVRRAARKLAAGKLQVAA